LQREVQICVVGKVFRPNKSKILALNKTLSEYFKLVKWYLSYTSTSTLVRGAVHPFWSSEKNNEEDRRSE